MSEAPEMPDRDYLVRRGLRFSHLRLIAALKESGQISAAAARMAISQPAASRMVAEMEDILGVSLYTRHARGVTLTRYGERLAVRAQGMLQGLDDTAREIVEMERGMRGTVSIGAVTGPALDLVLPTVRKARVTHPRISVTVTVDTSDRLAEALLASGVDFYIGRILGDVDRSKFQALSIGLEPMSLIVRVDHPLTRGPEATLRDCVAYDWVLQPHGGLQRRTVESHLMAQGLPLPQKVLSTASLMLTLAAVTQTNAIAPVAKAVADFCIQEQGLGARVVSLMDSAFAIPPYSLVSLSERALSPASMVLFSTIAAEAGLEGRGMATD
ncbi:LysR family transcriptional regulator [Breoghania sp. L-A4]|uniref:LysR family transcriptional regulator n=1 Tax=Breoghania sp. L-A4 TaxID=2304600 RepID=UPI000E35AC87|nr:LysR family transcriptional regulator [Breoghania sp. L-A4]AXS42719.1 LysR family transcriptional regulator [Breoghania sp. L-A4]